MRLIDTETLQFVEYFSDIPRYAILSHRWEDEEVTFQAYPSQLRVLSSSSGGSSGEIRMKGLDKIERCAAHARSDGLSYCWVDTCCIDKTSSAELSEAINSMYAWYRDSAVCYVYMSDVDVSRDDCPGGGDIPDALRGPALSQFGASQWFTRGWTLQELLAPSTRIFYDVNWVQLLRIDSPKQQQIEMYGVSSEPLWSSSNPEVHSVVKNATGINRKTLEGFSPKSPSFSAALKMSWASKRKTTRAEDMAYCLMGLFDINMPLLYGEGGAKAFRRLQEAIIGQTDDHSIFYWRDPTANRSTVRGLLARSPAEFSDSSGAQMPRWLPVTYTRGQGGDTRPKFDKTYGMTNRGLRIVLPIVQDREILPMQIRPGDDEELAMLDCECEGSSALNCCLVLARLSDDGHYARVDCHMLPPAIPGTYGGVYKPACTPREILVREEPRVHATYSSSRIAKAQFWENAHFAIVNVQPAELWDPNAREIRVGEPVFTGGDDILIARVAFQTISDKPAAEAVGGFRFSISLWWVGITEGEVDRHFQLEARFDWALADDPRVPWNVVRPQLITYQDARGGLDVYLVQQTWLQSDELVHTLGLHSVIRRGIRLS